LELQHEETDKFLSYFNKGIQYLKGGVESGFKHIEPDTYPLRLLCVKGERYPRVFEVPNKNDSFNEGDVYILDDGMELYLWAGSGANMYEKQKGMEVIVGLKNDDRHSKPVIFYPRDAGGELEDKFWSLIDGGKPEQIKAADEPHVHKEEDDIDSPFADYKFYAIDENHNYVPQEITERPLKATMLKDDMSFILKTASRIIVWTGKNASTGEKRYSMQIAKDFKKANPDF